MTTWRSFARLLHGSGRVVAIGLGISLLQSLALVPVGLLVRNVFNSVIPSGNEDRLVVVGAAILGLYLVNVGLGLVGRHVVLGATKAAVTRLREQLLTRVYSLPRAYFDRAELARLHSIIVQDSERLDVMSYQLLAQAIPAVVITSALLIALGFISPVLLALLLVVIPPMVVITRLVAREVRQRVRLWQHESDTFSARVLFSLRAMTLTKVHSAERDELAAARAQFAQLASAGHRMGWLAHAYALVQGGVAATAAVIVLVVGGRGVIAGSISLGEMLAFFALLALVRGQVTNSLTAMPHLVTGIEAMRRLHGLLDIEESEPYSGRRSIDFKGQITLDRVVFGYGPDPVLRELSMTIGASERVALLGPNGSGKSTVVSLMLGLYRPQRGQVLADEVAFDELDMRALRRQIGVVLQDPIVFRGTVFENIAYGRHDATGEEVRRAAELATAHEFVSALPDGYDTEVGDDGELLSAGQRQRIAVARALLGKPALLILDEPTTHLDDEAIEKLMANLAELPGSPSVLIVSHDPAVVPAIDRVYVLRDGRIAEVDAGRAPAVAYEASPSARA
jgi:ABC-type bacteriocin/lantibiotic exporter with double-glycine peptidase domain